jgi:thiol-disulfide isomerase/thioredoxin
MKVIKIGALWCSACLVMKPRWQQIEKENSWLQTQYFDFDQDKDKIEKYNLDKDSIPVFIFLDKKGQEFLRLNGEISIKELTKVINQHKDK